MFTRYIRRLADIVERAEVTDSSGRRLPLETAVESMGSEMRAAHDRDNKIMFVGNGGSAGICSHMATDFSKNGGMRALAMNDGAMLTCLSNDFGYQDVFAKQIEWHARSGDILVAISSSGSSANILGAVEAGRRKECRIYTLSGFAGGNPLRQLGDLNIYLASDDYGFVEVGHLALLHGVLDVEMGWVDTVQSVEPLKVAHGVG